VIGPDSRDSKATALAFIENLEALTVVSAPEKALIQ